MLKYKNVSYKIDNKKILSDVNLDVDCKKITAIIGPNGSGKSTIISLLNGDKKEYEGEIKYKNELLSNKDSLHQDISILMQNNSYPSFMSVKKFLEYSRILNKNFFYKLKHEDKEIVKWALNVCDLNSIENRKLESLSGGQRQRVFIAYALCKNPKLLVLDEPTTFLDIKYQIDVLDLIKKINREKQIGVIMVLHDINQAMKYADEIVVVNNGSIRNVCKNYEIDESVLKEVFDVDLCINRELLEVNIQY